MKRLNVFFISILLTFSVLSDSANKLQADENEYYVKIRKGLSYFQKVYERVQSNYVEEIDPYEFVKTGIDGMLGALDPYTVFIEEDEDARLRIITTGKYGGIGMEIGIRNNRVTIISPMDNSPAKQAGIRAGDIITKINKETVTGSSTERISKLLRGPIGSEVEITIQRPGFENEISLIIRRGEITIEDVNYADFIKPGIAYVHLTGFTDKASSELIASIKTLQQIGPITSFILDLRGNSGGLLESAVDIVGLFLPKGTLVVMTKGFRDGKNEFTTGNDPLLPDTPLIVLVNEGSASASEIVAGALQDLDRAVVVGTKTFGKGLVQKVYNIDKNSSTKVKITTARYYIPSGRCVQKQDFTKNNNLFFGGSAIDSTPSPLPYYTTNKRMVYESGGITPDCIIADDPVDYVVTELWRQSLVFNFTVQYTQQHPDLKEKFHLPDEVFTEFVSYLHEQNFNYQIEGENELKKFKAIAQKNNFPMDFITQTETLIKKLDDLKKNDLEMHKSEINKMLLDELAEKYFGVKEKIRYTILYDQQIDSAVNVLTDPYEYKKILAIR